MSYSQFRGAEPCSQAAKRLILAKLMACFVVMILSAAVTGCGESKEQSWFQNDRDRLAAQAEAGHGDRPASDDSGESFADDEFDLLADEFGAELIEISDPLEKWNRAVFKFNDGFYLYVAKPIIEGYEKLTPDEVRAALRCFFDNLGMPVRVVNCALQGKWEGARIELIRFGVNTTVGVLGFYDYARIEMGLEPFDEDMGQTLAVYGVENGCYLVWPFLGPSTLRDSGGKAVDLFMNPLFYVTPCVSVPLNVLKYTNEGSYYVGTYEVLTSDALDPYVAVRTAYIQHREKVIQE